MKVNQIVHEHKDKIKGKVYGPLIELFEAGEAYTTAVEVAAGNRYSTLFGYFILSNFYFSLFYVVVDSDETAAHILEIMGSPKDKSQARVTFIPLNISLRSSNYCSLLFLLLFCTKSHFRR